MQQCGEDGCSCGCCACVCVRLRTAAAGALSWLSSIVGDAKRRSGRPTVTLCWQRQTKGDRQSFHHVILLGVFATPTRATIKRQGVLCHRDSRFNPFAKWLVIPTKSHLLLTGFRSAATQPVGSREPSVACLSKSMHRQFWHRPLTFKHPCKRHRTSLQF